MPGSLRVALLIESYLEYARGLLRGIGAYGREQTQWTTYHQPWAIGTISAGLRRWRPTGIIARIESRELARSIQRMRIPAVGIYTPCGLTGMPVIMPDHQAVARLAVDHLVERGFKHFAYAGFAGLGRSKQRRTHFVDYLARTGYPAHVFEGPKIRSVLNVLACDVYNVVDSKAIVQWLRSLPRPLGLLTCDDLYARQVVNACTEYGIAVPDEVAVIGAGNDEVLCSQCHPWLSSVKLNPEEIGYQAAALLDRLMRGERPAQKVILVPPEGVVTRQSTDVLLGADQDIVEAIRYVRKRACHGIRVTDISQHTQISRSTLQRRFLETLGRSPKAELLRVQLERVKELLLATDLPLAEIAHQAGFNHVEGMCRLFKKQTGQTLQEFRKETRRRTASPQATPP